MSMKTNPQFSPFVVSSDENKGGVSGMVDQIISLFHWIKLN